MRHLLLLILLAVSIQGCATENQTLYTGNSNLTDANIESLKAGLKEDEVLAIMGAPDETIPFKDGSEEWVYRGSEGESVRPGALSRKSTLVRAKLLSVQFDSNGQVTKVIYDELNETEKKPF